MKTLTRVLTTLALAGALGACDQPVEPPVPGAMWVSLTTPATDDHAVQLTVRGPGVTGVRPTNSNHRLYWRLVSHDEARVIVIGTIASGPLLVADVADVNSGYSAEVTQVAASSDELRSTLAGYVAEVRHAGPGA